ncbi:MAG: hypothetical protein IJ188_03060 [Clostridia bacterium]|nr:hypothetical protein [Clostridia bacterium]
MKEPRAPSLLQPDGVKECYLTGVQTGLHLHHIYAGTANRKLSDRWGCWVWLKASIHADLHDRDKSIDLRLKQDCQRAFEAKYDHKTFMRIFGKSYL